MSTRRSRPAGVVAWALALSIGLAPAAPAGAVGEAGSADRPAADVPPDGAADGVVALTDAHGDRSTTALEALEHAARRDGSGPEAPPSAAGPADVAPGEDAIFTGPLATAQFYVAGLVWDGGENLPAGMEIHLRVREDGVWSEWLAAPEEDAADDRRGRQGTAPFVTGGADAVQVHVSGDPADLPPSLELSLIAAEAGSGDVIAPGAEVAAFEAAAIEATTAAAPAVIDRAGWGADETLMTWPPSYAESRAAVVHHTAGTNSYTSAESAGIVRAIYRYHAVSNGWGDIGYNFLVDRYGQVFEGRTGSLAAADGLMPAGAHAQGYNTYSMGIAAMGDFSTAVAPQVILDRVAEVIAWEFDRAGIDMATQAFFPANAYHADRYLPRIVGHRDLGNTVCPGDDVHGRLAALTADVTARLAGEPANTAPLVDAGTNQTVTTGTAVTLRGSASDVDDERLTFAWRQTSGTAVTLSGTATPTPTFTAPARATTLVFELAVNDGAVTVTDTVTVTVKRPAKR